MQLRANHLTASRILLLPVPCVLIFGGPVEKLVGLGLFAALGATDWYDGKLARKQGPTVLGGLLDPIADKMFLAFTYLPLTRIEGAADSGVPALPLWLVAAIFFRDLLITSLRSVTSAHGIEFHTSTLAKFKTAIQMGAGAFLMWAIVFQDNRLAWIAGYGAAVGLVVFLAAMRAGRGRKVGAMLWTQIGTYGGALLAAVFLEIQACLLALGLFVLAVTLVSGVQYVARVLKGMRAAGWPVGAGETALSAAETAAPVAAVSLFAIPGVPAFAPIAMLTAELAAGGLDNLLATEKIAKRSWISWARCLGLASLAAAGWLGASRWPESGLAPAAAIASAALSLLYAAGRFAAHRRVYLR